jgi:hypothetical protein
MKRIVIFGTESTALQINKGAPAEAEAPLVAF